MAFTFARGNVRRLACAPLQVFGDLAARTVTRDPNRWVFGSGAGIGEGALAVWDAAKRPGRVRIWLARDDAELAEARARGMQATLASGRAGFRATLRAGVIVITHGFGDVNRYAVEGALVVQLWHGIPLKRLHLDAPGTLRVAGLPSHPIVTKAMSWAMRRSTNRISLFPVASARVASRIESAFDLDDDVVQVLGDARDDVLAEGDTATRRETARATLVALGRALAPRVVLYAPTWRDGARDPGTPSATEWDAITEWLDRTDSTLLLRAHPLGRADLSAGPERSPRIQLLGSDIARDITPLLPAFDEVVTDYSSIAYDAAIAGVPTVVFAPDRGAYEVSRGLYDSLEEFAGEWTSTWAGVLDALDDVRGVGRARRLAHTIRLRDEHVDVAGGSARRVVAAIEARLAGTASQPVAPRRARLTSAVVEGDEIRLVFRGPRPATVRIVGPRGVVDQRFVTEGGPEAWHATIPVHRTLIDGTPTVLPSGDYRIDLERDDGARLQLDRASTLQLEGAFDAARLHLTAADASLLLQVRPPVDLSPAVQQDLERRMLPGAAPENAVFFESFEGTVAACNPLGIDRALAALRPDVTRYWSTTDASVPIPPGAIRIIVGSEDWWRVRGSARVLVVNEWLRKRWRRQPHQLVLQTWHGTPLKRLALDREGQSLRTRVAAVLESRRWGVMLAQNAFSEQVFRTAYRFSGPIWQLGYPRNDRIREPNATLRAALGIPADAPVVLYAPTWRDDRISVVDHIDVGHLADELPGTAVLVRGHARSVAAGARKLHGSVIDVTDVPDVADLLALADVVVTDYSSVMFDAASSDAAIILCQPDLADYRDRLRGFTFDVTEVAPGPIVQTLPELRQAIVERASWATTFAAAREAWRHRFAPADDGHAGERVVRRLEAEGWLPEPNA